MVAYSKINYHVHLTVNNVSVQYGSIPVSASQMNTWFSFVSLLLSIFPKQQRPIRILVPATNLESGHEERTYVEAVGQNTPYTNVTKHLSFKRFIAQRI